MVIALLLPLMIALVPFSAEAAVVDVDCDGTGFTNRIVTCVEDTLLSAVGEDEFQEIRDQIKGIIGWLFTLYIAFFGIQVALGGVQKPMSELVVHLFKLTAVAFFSISTGVDMVYPIFLGIQQGLMEIVTTSALIEGGNCTVNQATGATYTVIWERVDCLFANVLAADLSLGGAGTTDLSSTPFDNGAKVSYTLPATLLGLFFSTSIGLVVLILSIVTVFCVIIGFASAVVHYVMCLVAIVILATIAPLIIPAILFNSTKGFFDVWFRAFMAYTVQPAILFAYLAFMTHAMGIVINGSSGGTGDFGLYKTLEKAKVILDDPNSEKYENVAEVVSENLAGAGVTPGEVKGSGEDESRGGFALPKTEMSESDMAVLLVNLIAVTMIAAMLNAFMFNVMAFGAQLAGIPATFSMGNFTRTFSSAAFMLKGSTK